MEERREEVEGDETEDEAVTLSFDNLKSLINFFEFCE